LSFGPLLSNRLPPPSPAPRPAPPSRLASRLIVVWSPPFKHPGRRGEDSQAPRRDSPFSISRTQGDALSRPNTIPLLWNVLGEGVACMWLSSSRLRRVMSRRRHIVVGTSSLRRGPSSFSCTKFCPRNTLLPILATLRHAQYSMRYAVSSPESAMGEDSNVDC
jgi:hypothetical protein